MTLYEVIIEVYTEKENIIFSRQIYFSVSELLVMFGFSNSSIYYIKTMYQIVIMWDIQTKDEDQDIQEAFSTFLVLF